MIESSPNPERPDYEDERPLAAPCRQLNPHDPLRWLRLGWQDYQRSLPVSLGYGLLVALISLSVALLSFWLGRYTLLLATLSGFIFVAPVLAVGLYSVPRQLQRGDQPRLRQTFHRMARTLGDAMVFALVLMVIFLVWARSASMVQVFFPMESNAGWWALARFLLIGSVVGSLFALISFAAAAFSLPMITDRRVDAITACVTSINAVLRNRKAMLVWILLIVGLVGLGFATAGVGLIVVIPWLAYATYHAYQDTIDAAAWEPAAI